METKASSPTKFIMSDVDLPFTHRLQLRENILSWISRDVGLSDFFIPPNHPGSHALSGERKNSSILAVMHNYLGVSSPPSIQGETEPIAVPSSSASQSRCMARENASHLRRSVIALRRGRVTHFDVARFALLLETLWDEINVTLNDASWAMCSLKFDTSQVSLRLVYIWLYMEQEFPASNHPIHVRRAVYATLVEGFF